MQVQILTEAAASQAISSAHAHSRTHSHTLARTPEASFAARESRGALPTNQAAALAQHTAAHAALDNADAALDTAARALFGLVALHVTQVL